MNTASLKQLFWDVSEQDLTALNSETVIARTLSHGTFAQIAELFSVYGRAAITRVFTGLKPGAISARRRSYFTLILS
ncbi:MAG: hypothetical protein WAT81_01225 [Candidatus Moraniibacteriota bacterium]